MCHNKRKCIMYIPMHCLPVCENKQKRRRCEYIFDIRIIAMCNTNTFEKSKVFVEIAKGKW